MVNTLSETLIAKQATLTPHFKPGFLQREKAVFQFTFINEEAFYLDILNNSFQLIAGEHQAPTLSCSMKDHDTCWGLLDGTIDGMKAFMDGDYRADGNIVLSQLLLYLFKSNDPTLAYEMKY